MGFSPQEENKFHRIFELSQTHARFYSLKNTSDITPVEILIIKKGDEFILQQQQAYLNRHPKYSTQIVTVGREIADPEDTYYIRGVLIPSRVFAILDVIEKPEAVAIESSLIAETNTHEEHLATSSIPTFQVLVVDDSQMMQKTVQLELEKATIPLSINFADDGESALKKIAEKKYDFIFLDVMMPGIDGFETCTQIRKMEGMAKTPIIMLTSKTSAMDEVKGLMAGCSTYLTKPFEHDEFQKILDRIMRWVKEFNNA